MPRIYREDGTYHHISMTSIAIILMFVVALITYTILWLLFKQ